MFKESLPGRVVEASQGTTYRVVTDLVTFKAVAENTAGAYSLFVTQTLPGQGTPPHLQHYEDEAFFILAGTYLFRMGDQQIQAKAGDYLFVPRETIHAYTNIGSEVAKMVILVSPGGLHEKFFAEAGDPIADLANPPEISGPPDLPRLLSVAAKYGVDILPPE